MIEPIFYINKVQVPPPKNWPELSFQLNYGKDQFPGTGVLTITDFVWVRENYDRLTTYIEGGKTGDVGITEAPSLRVDLTNGTVTKTCFYGFINLMDGMLIKDRISVTAKATSHATVDWINEVAGSFTFEYLASLPDGAWGRISTSQYKFVPYVLSDVPDYAQAGMITVMAFEVGKGLYDALKQLYDLVADIIANWSDIEIAELIKIVIELVYIIALIATLIKLVEDIIKFIISPVKYHAGMYVRDLMSKAVEFLSQGKMTFVSDIWAGSSPYYNELIIPEKHYNKQADGIFGFLEPDTNEQEGYYKGTFAQLLDAMKIKYNAKIVVTANPDGTGTVSFVRRDKNVLPPAYQLKGLYEPEYTYNTSELAGNYLIEFQTDSQDRNTLQSYQGTIYQVITQQKTTNYQPFSMVKNEVPVIIPFARATRKTELTTPEKIYNDFLPVGNQIAQSIAKVASSLIEISQILGEDLNTALTLGFNNITESLANKVMGEFKFSPEIQSYFDQALSGSISKSYLDPIEAFRLPEIGDRIGMMLLSSDQFGVPKVLIFDERATYSYGRINPNNSALENAKAAWDQFHYVNSFIPTSQNSAYPDRPTGNQFEIRRYTNEPFDFEDFLKVLQNNAVYDTNGKPALVESLKFNPYKGGGCATEIVVRFPKIYTLNLKETFLYPIGA